MIALKSYWLLEEVENNMPDMLLIFYIYFLVLIKKTEDLNEEAKVRKFFQPWLRVDKYIIEILVCLQRSISNGRIIPTKTAKKLTL